MKPLIEVPRKPALSTASRIEVPMKKTRRRLTTKSLFQGLVHELTLLAATYARVSSAHAPLAAYPTLPSLLERLTTGARDDAKKELVAALVGISKAAPHRLWGAILLRTFRPMLLKLWKELFGADKQERLALLLISFQAAIGHVNPERDPIRVAMYVRQGTRRRVLVALGKEQRWDEVGFGEEADTVADVRPPDTPFGEHWRDAQRLLRRGALTSYVRRSHPSLSRGEQRSICRRLRRGIQQTLRRMSSASSVVSGQHAEGGSL